MLADLNTTARHGRQSPEEQGFIVIQHRFGKIRLPALNGNK
jgi:hypothetical protein